LGCGYAKLVKASPIAAVATTATTTPARNISIRGKVVQRR